MRYRIDQGDPASRVVVAICECGSRFLAVDRPSALTRLAAHEAIRHPRDKNARADLAKLTRPKRPRATPTTP
jgi:hypothetical protein